MRSVLLTLILLVMTPAAFAADDDLEVCYSQKFTQREIDVCTRLIGTSKAEAKDLAGIYYERALKYRLTKQYPSALADVNTAAKLDPDFKFSYTLRGHVNGDLGNLDRAIEDHTTAIKMSPDSAVAYNGRAIEYMRQKKYDLAFADFDRSLVLNAKYFYAYFYRGDAYLETGDVKKAIADYEMAASIEPADQNIKIRLQNAEAKLLEADGKGGARKSVTKKANASRRSDTRR